MYSSDSVVDIVDDFQQPLDLCLGRRTQMANPSMLTWTRQSALLV